MLSYTTQALFLPLCGGWRKQNIRLRSCTSTTQEHKERTAVETSNAHYSWKL